jgi:hypothetical protein
MFASRHIFLLIASAGLSLLALTLIARDVPTYESWRADAGQESERRAAPWS